MRAEQCKHLGRCLVRWAVFWSSPDPWAQFSERSKVLTLLKYPTWDTEFTVAQILLLLVRYFSAESKQSILLLFHKIRVWWRIVSTRIPGGQPTAMRGESNIKTLHSPCTIRRIQDLWSHLWHWHGSYPRSLQQPGGESWQFPGGWWTPPGKLQPKQR